MRRSRFHALRLRHLWITYLLAMLFHVELGLMPLFHGISPEIESHVPAGSLGWLYWAMLLYFLIPLLCILLIAYAEQEPPASGPWRCWRVFHWGSA